MDLGEDINTHTTRLLTLLNVSALKSRKRTRDEDLHAHEKLNRRKTIKLAEDMDLDPDDKINPDVEDATGANEDSDELQGMLSL